MKVRLDWQGVTRSGQIKNECIFSVRIWLLFVLGVHYFHAFCSLSCIPIWMQSLSLLLSPEWQQGDQLTPLCGKCFSDESPCVSRTHTTVSEAFVEISFVTFANNVVSDKCRLHHFTTCSLPNKLVFYKGCQIPPVTQTDQEAAHEIFQPPPPHLFFLISLKILLHHLWMIKS